MHGALLVHCWMAWLTPRGVLGYLGCALGEHETLGGSAGVPLAGVLDIFNAWAVVIGHFWHARLWCPGALTASP